MKVAGFGFRRQASVDSLKNALSLAGHTGELASLAAPADKTQAQAFMDFATVMGLPITAITQDALQNQTTETQSTASLDTRGVGSVAEAAALAAVGPGARLVSPRVVSADGCATCAIAEGVSE